MCSSDLAACIRSDELKGQDRYEAGQVFEATSADAELPASLNAAFEAGVPAAHVLSTDTSDLPPDSPSNQDGTS